MKNVEVIKKILEDDLLVEEWHNEWCEFKDMKQAELMHISRNAIEYCKLMDDLKINFFKAKMRDKIIDDLLK